MKSAVLLVTAICIVSSALFIFTPKGKMEKVMKYALGIFFIASVIAAVLSIDFNADFNLDVKDDFSQTGTDITNATAEIAISQILLRNNIHPLKIEVDTDKTSDDSISIKRIVLTLDTKEDFNRAAQIIKEETGITAVEQ